jgi:hypothetical protein
MYSIHESSTTIAFCQQCHENFQTFIEELGRAKKAVKPEVMPGIVHIDPPMLGQEILITFSCTNMDDILALHVNYWESKD